MLRTLLALVLLGSTLLLVAAGSRRDDSATAPPDAAAGRAEMEMTIDGSLDAVWRAFSTEEGLAGWMAPQVEADFRIGGTIRTHYDAAGTIGDEGTIESTILAFDPQRMLALRATKLPKGFPFPEAAKGTWSVFYFAAESPERTRITVAGLGYTDTPESKSMRRFFEAGNRDLIGKLERSLAKEQGGGE